MKCAHKRAIKNYIDNKSNRSHQLVELGDRVYMRSPIEKAKLGKYQVCQWFGPYIIKALYDDMVQAWMKKDSVLNAADEYVHLSNLAPAKSRSLIPVYSNTDMVIERRKSEWDQTKTRS